MRQIGLIRPEEIPPITIVGAGSAGTGIAVVATKLGVNDMTIWDADEVATHNISNQYFKGDSIGMKKVEALKEEIERLSPIGFMPMITIHDKFLEESDSVNSPIVFMCVDGMENRRRVMDVLIRSQHPEWAIDSRMSGEYLELRTVKLHQPSEVEEYYKSLEGETREEPCSARSVIYTIMQMSARAVLYMKNIVKNKPVPLVYTENLGDDRIVPYHRWRAGEKPMERM
jgi:molybdopterin/thiamine biosynthesis adenylyltransferase